MELSVMPKVTLSILIDNTPDKEVTAHDPIAVVRDWIEQVESGCTNSGYAWARLRYLFNRLAKMPRLTRKMKQVFNMIEPVMQKYGPGSNEKVELAASYAHEDSNGK
jgi:hypothetical protein